MRMHVSRLILLPVLALAVAAQGAHAAPSPIVRVLSCSPWQEGLGGTVSFEARMRAVPGTARMTLRFDLLEKTRSGSYRRVSRGKVNRSRRGANVFRWEHKVEGLRQGVRYRAKVVYRWLDASGSVLQSLVRKSGRCRQPGGLADLRVAQVTTAPGAVAGTAVYDVRVVNEGGSDARGVVVVLRVDGEVVDESDAIETLAPGDSRTLSFSGPVCRDEMRATVDPSNAIVEADEQDNVNSTQCV